jgi:ceramide glucosyltransferase
MTIAAAFGWTAIALAGLGIAYTCACTIMVRRFFAVTPDVSRASEPVTILKPLFGAEPQLYRNLHSFVAQDHGGQVQVLCGIADRKDSAVPVVAQLAEDHSRSVALVVDGQQHGGNRKISNLINILRHADHPTLVISDSDILVEPDYLAHVLHALRQPDVGAATCLHRGRGDNGFWSVLGAAGVSYQFLPDALFAYITGLAKPCMGSTIAIRQETLNQAGGLECVADCLADDYAIGEKVRALGKRIALPRMLVVHCLSDKSMAELCHHELRWGVTLREISLLAHVFSVIRMPFPLALLGMIASPGIGSLVAVTALFARWLLVGEVDRAAGERSAPAVLLPLRDCLSFVIHVSSMVPKTVLWRSVCLRVAADGRIFLPRGRRRALNRVQAAADN